MSLDILDKSGKFLSQLLDKTLLEYEEVDSALIMDMHSQKFTQKTISTRARTIQTRGVPSKKIWQMARGTN